METNVLTNYAALPGIPALPVLAQQARGSSRYSCIQNCCACTWGTIGTIGAISFAAWYFYVPLNVWIDCTRNPREEPPCGESSLTQAKMWTVIIGVAYTTAVCAGFCYACAFAVERCRRSRTPEIGALPV